MWDRIWNGDDADRDDELELELATDADDADDADDEDDADDALDLPLDEWLAANA